MTSAQPVAPGRSAPRPAALEFVVLGLLVAVPLVFDPVAGRDGARVEYALPLVGGGLAAVLLTAKRRSVLSNPLRWPVVALLACTALSAGLSDHPRTALRGFPDGYDGLWSALALSAVFFATAATFSASSASRVLVASGSGPGRPCWLSRLPSSRTGSSSPGAGTGPGPRSPPGRSARRLAIPTPWARSSPSSCPWG